MTKAPNFTTLQKAEQRLLNKAATRKLLQETIRFALTPTQMKNIIELAAIDGSGFEARHISNYFVRRRNSKNDSFYEDVTYRRYPYLGMLCDCSTHMVLAIGASRGPSPDIRHFFRVLKQAVAISPIKRLLGDKGYDSEGAHEFAHQYGVRCINSPRQYKNTLPKKLYG